MKITVKARKQNDQFILYDTDTMEQIYEGWEFGDPELALLAAMEPMVWDVVPDKIIRDGETVIVFWSDKTV